MAAYAGNHWYKCDLHIHTMSSECYAEKDNTPEMWVDRALEQGLQVCAVTDHNDYRGMREIRTIASEKGLKVFPGVEITCDSSKIHMLVLFDTARTAETVRDFLNRCDIDSDLVGTSRGTSLSVFEVCEIAKKRGALVIAAHIDEFNSISVMNVANLEKLLASGLLDAVQVVNVPVWERYERDKDQDAMNAALRDKYGPEATPELIETWRKCYKRVREMKLPMIASSDNPHSETETKHGLWGIGKDYTWVQMGEFIDLESLHQALIAPESRIRMCFDSPSEPKTEPEFWICSLEVRKSLLNPHMPLHIDFHPQLNCIIGSRGSGKSSVVKILSGVYQQLAEGMLLDSMKDENAFYRRNDESGSGIFQKESEIEIIFMWYGDRYRLVVSNIIDAKNQTYQFWYTDPEKGEEVSCQIGINGFKSLMTAEVFTHGQIYEIAKRRGALTDYVDRSLPDIYLLKQTRDYLFEHMLLVNIEIHAIEKMLGEEDRVTVEKTWLDNLIISNEYPGLDGETEQSMIRLREEALAQFASYRTRLEELREEQSKCRKNYYESLAKIQKARKKLLEKVLADDENYRIELVPSSSRASFENFIQELLKVEGSLIREDILKLENALFDKKSNHRNYENMLLEIRNEEKNGFSDYFRHLITNLSGADFERLMIFCPEDELTIAYHPNGVKRFFPLNRSSAGECSAAVLAFLLFNGNTPLIIDQPEDNLDNRIIYEEFLSKLRRAKHRRQIIFVTHNAIITTNADAEMIVSMEPKSKFTRVRMAGSMDDPAIRKEICEILEGTGDAFRQRARKYHFD